MVNKPNTNDPNNKAPVTGSTSAGKSDDKATADGRPVDPGRPKSD